MKHKFLQWQSFEHDFHHSAASMRYALLILLVLSTGLLRLGLQASAQEASAASQLVSLKQALSQGHAEFGQRYFLTGMIREATIQFRSALYFDTDNVTARAHLGFERKEGAWVAADSKNTAQPEEKPVASNIVVALAQQYEEMSKAHVTKIIEVADVAVAKGDDPTTHTCARLILFYDAQNDWANHRVGNEKVDDVWLPKVIADAGRVAAERLKTATEGVSTTVTEAVSAALPGRKLVARSSANFLFHSTLSEDRTKRLFTVADGALAVSRSLLGHSEKHLSPWKNVGQMPVYVTEDQADHEAIINMDQGRNAAEKANAARYVGTWGRKPWSLIIREEHATMGDDLCANSVAYAYLKRRRGGSSAPWVETGFSYLVTSQLLQTAVTRRYERDRPGRTSVYRHKGNPTSLRGNPYPPEDLRILALDMVRLEDDVPLAELAQRKLNEMDPRDAAKALSLMEFLLLAKKDQARKWLNALPKKGEEDIKALAATFDWTPEQLNEAWKAWVLANY